MKTKTMIVMLVALSISSAFAGKEGGGGGVDEAQFKEIAQNISDWIQSGNADQIKLPAQITLSTYKTKMLAVLSNYDVVIGSEPVPYGKTCWSTQDGVGKNHVKCYFPIFDQVYRSSIDQTYQLIHHEFAGLARLEKNVGSDSDWSISNQISGYLAEEMVRRLPVSPVSSSHDDSEGAKPKLSQMEVGQKITLSRDIPVPAGTEYFFFFNPYVGCELKFRGSVTDRVMPKGSVLSISGPLEVTRETTPDDPASGTYCVAGCESVDSVFPLKLSGGKFSDLKLRCNVDADNVDYDFLKSEAFKNLGLIFP